MAVATWELQVAPRPSTLRLVQPGSVAYRRGTPVVYRRRRLAVLLVAVGIVMAVVPAAGLGVRPAGASGGADAPTTVVVQPGDTVWDLVAPHVPAESSTHVYVAGVLQRNGVDARHLAPGTVLELP
ncbi:MAG: hypothetical protein ACRDU8_10295 [Egibacteraceae bacterium]